jgi:hypothetical protein
MRHVYIRGILTLIWLVVALTVCFAYRLCSPFPEYADLHSVICDPALDQAVRFLPGQEKAFLIPYCTFIFLRNMTSDIIFLFSWEIQNGGITIIIVLTALCFALQSAISAVLLEWFFPLKEWKIESDLWHHPRKYVVPTAMLLLAGVVGTLPWFAYLLIVILLIECNVLLLKLRRC